MWLVCGANWLFWLFPEANMANLSYFYMATLKSSVINKSSELKH